MRLAALLPLLCACRLHFDATSDATGDDTGSSATCAGYLVCDEFEGPGFDPRWLLNAGVTLENTNAHRGQQSAHVHLDAFTAGMTHYRHLGDEGLLATSSAPEIWVRGWFYVTSFPATGNRMELMSVESPASTGGTADYTFLFSDRIAIYAGSGGVASSDPQTPVGTWFCLVFDILRSTTTSGYLKLTSDVVSPASVDAIQTDAAARLDNVYFGVGYAAANVTADQPATDIWIDDVIVDTKPVACTDY